MAKGKNESKSTIDTKPVVESKPPETPKPPVAAPPIEIPSAPPTPRVYRVVDGKSITSFRGVIGPGSPVSARDLSGGQAALETLIESGIVA